MTVIERASAQAARIHSAAHHAPPESAIARYEPPPAVARHEPTAVARYEERGESIAQLRELKGLCDELVGAQLVPRGMTGADIFIIAARGRELGLGMMQALAGIHVIEGRATLSADLMVALARGSAACEWWAVRERSAARAVVETQRRGDPEPVRVVYTLDDARRAGLFECRCRATRHPAAPDGGAACGPWRRHTPAMLYARAASALARLVYPDLLAGLYAPEEMTDEPRDVGPGPRRAPAIVAELTADAPDAPPLDYEPANIDDMLGDLGLDRRSAVAIAGREPPDDAAWRALCAWLARPAGCAARARWEDARAGILPDVPDGDMFTADGRPAQGAQRDILIALSRGAIPALRSLAAAMGVEWFAKDETLPLLADRLVADGVSVADVATMLAGQRAGSHE